MKNNMNILKGMFGMLLFIAIIGVFLARETYLSASNSDLSSDDIKWRNYPKMEYMLSADDTQPTLSKNACKAYQEHKSSQPLISNDAAASSKMLWKIKNDELHAQCLIETIEETIVRLREQLKKDRISWQQGKMENSQAYKP